jgi:hypothetical protein
VRVEQRGWETIDEVDAYDAAVALGVFDYVGDAVALLGRMARAAPEVIASFPSPGLRTQLRRVRYGWRGVDVFGRTADDLADLGAACDVTAVHLIPLGRAGHLVHFSRPRR